jgi:hypothetical protein
MSAAHTPGPWGWCYDGSSTYSVGPEADPQDGAVASVYARKHNERTIANLALITAAPDLLEACELIQEHCPTDCDVTPKFYMAWQALLNAIAKTKRTESARI